MRLHQIVHKTSERPPGGWLQCIRWLRLEYFKMTAIILIDSDAAVVVNVHSEAHLIFCPCLCDPEGHC